MKMLTGKSVSIAVFLQLCFSAHVVKANYQFGDLLESPRAQDMDKPGYKHYAVYVGGETVKGKEDDQNIFEIKRDPPGCRFHTKPGPFKVNNYLDEERRPQSTDDMIKTIEDLMSGGKCKDYHLWTGNCEHIATMVRYGKYSRKKRGTLSDKMKAAKEAVKEAVKAGAEAVKEKVKAGAEAVKEKVKAGAEAVKEKVKAGVDAVKAGVEAGVEAAKASLAKKKEETS